MQSAIELLESANDLVAKAELPEEFREVAFGKAFDYLLLQSEAGVDNSRVTIQKGESRSDARSEIALESGLDPDIVGSVYLAKEGQIKVIVPTRYLSKAKLPGTQEVAILLSAGRKWAGVGEWTSAVEIRDNCEHLGTLDSKNFASTLRKIDVFSGDGNGQDRVYRINQVGLERAKTMLESWFQAE